MSNSETDRNSLVPLPARTALDSYFLDLRCRLLDIAASLDRIDRGLGASEALTDPRMARIQEALEILQTAGDNRAERIQQVFSLGYDANWEKPKPRF